MSLKLVSTRILAMYPSKSPSNRRPEHDIFSSRLVWDNAS